ncbi:MAG: hypothetical protein AB1478_03205 [Nitrospirota bacterium]
MREFIIYQDNNDLWVAECKELPGYKVKGETKEEAIEKIKLALLLIYPCKCEDREDSDVLEQNSLMKPLPEEYTKD